MAELIAGVGYRQQYDGQGVFGIIQSSSRFYDFPVVTIVNENIELNIDDNTLWVNRYTVGYEYEVDRKAFLTVEFFATHTLDKLDYWVDEQWAMGFTIGVTTTIF